MVEAVSHYSVLSGLKGERQRCGAMSFVTRLIHPQPLFPFTLFRVKEAKSALLYLTPLRLEAS